MADPRFLLIRLGSLGDIIHALPAASALRDAFPSSRIDWAVEPKWARLLEGNPDISDVIAADRKNARGIAGTIRTIRSANYTCAVDFQALYKSALLGYASGAAQRVGFQSSYAREGLAVVFYTDRLNPRGPHKVDHNLTLVEHVGAIKSIPRFPLTIHPEEEECIKGELDAHKLNDYFVLNPGGGWQSKCWPAERYGVLHRKLAERLGWRGVVSVGPGEKHLAERVIQASGDLPPVVISVGIGPLMPLLRDAKFVVSADTGPLHLASALGARVIGLYGPTDPSRNGPYSSQDITVRNPRECETTYRRGKDYASSMLSITVDQVFDAALRRLERGS